MESWFMLFSFTCFSKIKKPFRDPQAGFLLLAVMILMLIATVVAGSIFNSNRMQAKLTAASTKIADDYYLAEESSAKTLAWLHEYSPYLVSPFLAANHGSFFEITAPFIGANDVAEISIPSMVKAAGTNNLILLSNDESLGTSYFPDTTHISNGSAFNPVTAFNSADLGQSKVRLTLISIGKVGESMQPVFRLHIADRNLGTLKSYIIKGKLASNTSTLAAFYSTTEEMTLGTANNSCQSHQWSYQSGAWSKGAAKSNCIIASDSDVIIKGNIRGSVLSKSAVTLVPSSGKVSGTICQSNSSCHDLTLANYNSWADTCAASNRGDLTISSNTALSVASNTPSDNCWRDLRINSNSTLTLTTSNIPYHFRHITFDNTNSSKLAFTDISAAAQVILYVESFTNVSINGKNFDNKNNAPHQVKLNITGNQTLNINGDSSILTDLTAPDSQVNLNGNFNFYGGIKAKQINISDNVVLSADEQLVGLGAITGMSFTLKK